MWIDRKNFLFRSVAFLTLPVEIILQAKQVSFSDILLRLCLILVLCSHYVTHLSSSYLICTTGPFVSVYRTYLGSCPHLGLFSIYRSTVMLQSGSRCIAAMSPFVLPCLPSYSVLITHASCGPSPPDLADDLPLSIGDTRASCYQFLTHFLLYISQYLTKHQSAYS